MYKIGLKNSYLLMKSLHVDFWHEWSSYNIKTICKNLSCELFINCLKKAFECNFDDIRMRQLMLVNLQVTWLFTQPSLFRFLNIHPPPSLTPPPSVSTKWKTRIYRFLSRNFEFFFEYFVTIYNYFEKLFEIFPIASFRLWKHYPPPSNL